LSNLFVLIPTTGMAVFEFVHEGTLGVLKAMESIIATGGVLYGLVQVGRWWREVKPADPKPRAKMSLADMNAEAASELRRVPRGGLPQNMYRMALQQYVMNSQGRNPQIPRSRKAAHAAALQIVRQHYPSFTPRILKGFGRR
jgi:hypothetical protein